MWIYANPNHVRDDEPDCVVRAISIATGMAWDDVHRELCEMSREKGTMPSVNWLWGLWLTEHGFQPFLLPESCPECVTVREFCKKFSRGVYVIGTGSHAVAVRGGNYMDAWDSGDTVPTYFFKRRKQ